MYTLFVTNPDSDISSWKDEITKYTLYHHYSTDRPTLNLLHNCLGFEWNGMITWLPLFNLLFMHLSLFVLSIESNSNIFPEFGAHFIFELHYNASSDSDITVCCITFFCWISSPLSPVSLYQSFLCCCTLHLTFSRYVFWYYIHS